MRATVSTERTKPGEAARNLLQQLVARAVPERIVDQLESVEVAHHQRERTPVAVGVRDRLRQPIIQQHAIRQAGQRIVGGEMAQLAVRGLQAAGAHVDHLLERAPSGRAPDARCATCG